MKSVESISKLNQKLEKKIAKREHYFLVPNEICFDVKPISEKINPKQIIDFSDNPIPLIRNVVSQPLYLTFQASFWLMRSTDTVSIRPLLKNLRRMKNLRKPSGFSAEERVLVMHQLQ